MPVAKARAFGISENPSELAKKAAKIVEELEYNKVFSVSYTDFILGEAKDETQIDMIFKNSGIESFNEKEKLSAMNRLLKPFVGIFNLLQKTGTYIETLPKAAGVFEFTGGDVSKLTAEQRSYIRKNIGSPDFLAKGYLTPVTNDLFLFSNAITQGIRSDIGVMTNPKTRSGYWWKTAKLTFLPKILMFMASIGLLGAEVKSKFDDVSEYDKTNYTIVPVGTDSNGKTIYIRIPDDETGRLLGAILWKTLTMFKPTTDQQFGRQLADIFSMLGGQVPSITPSISTTKDIFDYLSGKNPYDDFRGRNVLSDDLYKANNWETDKAFLGYVFNNIGGGIFYRFNTSGSKPTITGKAEELVNLPVISNIIGRFIRVSDYGQTERLKNISATEDRDVAREKLSTDKLVSKYTQQIIDGGNKDEIERALLKEKFGTDIISKDKRAEADRLLKKFRLSVFRGVSPSEIDQITYAQTNAKKVLLIKELKSKMSESEFNNLKETLIKEKIISKDAFKEVYK
jgi:hypothetical protein